MSGIPAMKIIKSDGTVVEEAAMAQVKDKGRDEPEELFNDWQKLM